MNKLVYIAGPYRADTKELVKANIKKAEVIAVAVLLRGDIPVIPHKITSFFDDHEKWGHFKEWDISSWLNRFNFPLLERCDCMELTPGWKKSQGCRAEKEFAESRGIEVIFPPE